MSPARRACRSAAAAALGWLAASAVLVDAGARDDETDPVGVWNCLMYGPSGDQRFYLNLAADGRTRMARPGDANEGEWRSLVDWRRSRDRIGFTDALNARLFTVTARHEDLDLGGTWLGVRDKGGWWCAAVPGADVDADEPPDVGGLMRTLVPAIMASPQYPRSAIRAAKEGRTVSCFIVTGEGEIRRPVVVESSDEVFREPTLEAVAQSRYRSWGDEDDALPACRSFTFELRTAG